MSDEDTTGLIEDEPNPKRRSRWVTGSGIPRYEKKVLDSLDCFVEEKGWHRGAKVGKTNE